MTVLEANVDYTLQGVSTGRIQGGYHEYGRASNELLVFQTPKFDFADSVVDFCRRQVSLQQIQYDMQIKYKKLFSMQKLQLS